MQTNAQGQSFGERHFGIKQSTWCYFGLSVGTMGFYAWHVLYKIAKVLRGRYEEAKILPVLLLVTIGIYYWDFVIESMIASATSEVLVDAVIDGIRTMNDLETIGGIAILNILSIILELIFGIASLVLVILLGIKMGQGLDRMFQEEGLNVTTNKILCCVIFGIYHYYKIRNAEEDSAKNTMVQQNMAAATAARPAPQPAQTQVPQAQTQAFQAQPQAPAQNDKFAQLEKLAQLRDSGAITPEEFEAQKARILQ